MKTRAMRALRIAITNSGVLIRIAITNIGSSGVFFFGQHHRELHKTRFPLFSMTSAPTTYDRQRDRARDWARRSSQKGRDIGPLPEVFDPDRRESCRLDFGRFCEQYHPNAFKMRWSSDHLKLIDRIQRCVLDGGLHGFVMPRGSGKTTILSKAGEWASIYGHRRWVCLIGSAEEHAKSLVQAIKTDLTWNLLLREDFPESVLPVAMLEGEARRCAGQTLDGVPTAIKWEVGRLILPTVAGSACSGSVVSAAGLTGNLRGQQHTTPDGDVIRPDFVIPDDPQTAESANSPAQVKTRRSLINSDVINMGGPGVKIAGVMAGTVQREDDLMHQFLDRQKAPDWQGERMQMVYKWPKNEELWDKYGVIRSDELAADGDGSKATAFYKKNRKKMDEGAEVAWDERFNGDEISAIQHAYNLRFRDEESFWTEYQNEPLQADVTELAATAEMVRKKENGYARREVPGDVNHITAFIDVQDRLLWWVVCGWSDDFTGYVLDYGGWPDQKRRYYTLRDIKATLSGKYGGAGLEGGWLQGIRDLSGSFFDKPWVRTDGVELSPALVLVDAAYGASRDTVHAACDQFGREERVVPSHGVFIGATTAPFNDRKPRPGERRGFNCRMEKIPDSPRRRRAAYDANFWKSFVHERVAFSVGDRGGLTLPRGKPGEHDMFADQFCAEVPTVVEAKGRRVVQWKSAPSRPDNHFLDCAAGCAVAASLAGVRAEGHSHGGGGRRKRKSVKLSELQGSAG